MKRNRISLLLTLIAVVCLGVAAIFSAMPVHAEGEVEVELGKNIVTDSTLDSGNMNGWNMGWKNGTFQGIDTTEDAGGTEVAGSIKLENASRSNQHAATQVYLKKGQLYEVSLWIKTDNVVTTGGGTGVYLGICEGSGDTNVATLGYYGDPATVGTRPWFKFTATYTANVDGEHRLKLRLWGSSGTAWFDNIEMKAVEKATSEIVDPNFGFGDLTFWNTSWSHDGAIHLFDAETSHTDDGSGSAYIYHPTDPNIYAGYIGQKINLTENTRYKFSGWIKTENIEINTANSNGGAYFSLDDKYVFRFGSGLGKGKGTKYSQDWTYYESEFTATYTGLHTFQLKMWGAWGKAWFDEVKVEVVYDIDPEVLKHWTENVEFPTDDGGFTLVGIGDTQGFAGSYPDRYYGMSEWIVSKKDAYNVQYAMHLGDIVDVCGNPAQWNVAVQAQKILQDGGVKYSLSPGNHDYEGLTGLTADQKVPRDTTTYNTYFKKADYDAWLGNENFGTYDNTMDNSWHKFEVDGYKYMIIALEFGPRDEIIAWANNLCASNPDYNVIITTHAYLSGMSELDDSEARRNLEDANGGLTLWNELVSKHANIFMAIGGHYVSYGVNTNVLYGDHGNPVIQMKVDPQNILGGGEPMIALYRITNGTQVSTFYYSTFQNKYYAGSNFSLNLIKGKESLNGRVEVVKGTTVNIFDYKQLDGVAAKATYTVSNTKLATISEDGKLTAKGVGEITVTVKIDSRNSAYADKGCLTVATIPVKISGVKFTEMTATFNAADATLTAGDSLDALKQYLTVNGKYNDGTEKTVTTYTLSLENGKTTLSEGENVVTVTSNAITTTFTVTAEKANNVTVTVNAVNGTVKGLLEGNQIPAGVPTQITAKADAGYMFVSWEDGSINPTRIVTFTEDTTITANFTLKFINSNVNAYTGYSVSDGRRFDDSWAICGIRITQIYYIWDDNENYKVFGMLNRSDSPDVVAAYPEYKDTPSAYQSRYTITYLYEQFNLAPGFHKITMYVVTENGAVHTDKTFYPFLEASNVSTVSPVVATVNEGAALTTNMRDESGNLIPASLAAGTKVIVKHILMEGETRYFMGYYQDGLDVKTVIGTADAFTFTTEKYISLTSHTNIYKETESKPIEEGGKKAYTAAYGFAFAYEDKVTVQTEKGEVVYYTVKGSPNTDEIYYVRADKVSVNDTAFVIANVEIIVENADFAEKITCTYGLVVGENKGVLAGKEYTVTVIAPAAIGVEATVSGGKLKSLRTASNVRFEITSESVTVRIRLYEKTYEIGFAATEGGSIEGESEQTVVHGKDSAAVTAVPAEGYRFVKWSNGKTEPTLVIVGVKKDQTYTATFEKISFAVVTEVPETGYYFALISGEGGYVNCDLTAVEYGTEVTVTAIAEEGFLFKGWADGTLEATRTLTLTENTTLTAVFEEIVLSSITATVNVGETTVYAGATLEEIKALITVEGTYTDGTVSAIAEFTVALAEGETLAVGENVITVTVGEVTTTVTVTAVEKPVEPSVEESVEPSVEPSVEETIEPTVEPSVEESVEPSVEPSVEESIEPSVDPTTAPTVAPTETPSVEESVAPTTAPSKDEGKGGSSCGAVAPTNGGNGGGTTLLLVALLAVACLLFKKKAA